MTRVLLCDCGGSQKVDAAAIGTAGLACSRIHTALCTRQIDLAADALRADADTVIACAQEAPTFAALAEELGLPEPVCIDIRDRAGWSDRAADAGPKQAALLAEGLRPRQPQKIVDVVSHGMCLILGHPDVALPAAEALSETLSVTVLLTEPEDVVPGPVRRYDVVLGRLRRAAGTLGRFTVTIDALREASPVGRGPLDWTPPRDGGTAECDIIVDLSGAAPLFPAHEKRDGYMRADPGDRTALARVLREASHHVGTFEKVLHVTLDASLCAHSRARQTGCTRCLDLCPTGAITPDGDHVAIDPMVCAGCGACSAVCPSGAVSFDAPAVPDIFAGLRTLAAAYRTAGGTAPRLLVHDALHGREMISLCARLGRGLPADVIPFELPTVSVFGHAEAMGALAVGFSEVCLLPGPRSDRDTIARETTLAAALTHGLDLGARVRVLDATDPLALTAMLGADIPAPLRSDPILPLGHRRDITRLAARALAPDHDRAIALPDGAPYGAVIVDTDACTLCLSCVGLCPSGALDDNPDRPELRFKEDACLQCGLCANICPEDAITYAPRLDLSDAALRNRVLHEEEPYDCIECGKPFGVKSTIERVVAQLEGRHAMFTNSDNARLIRMCDDCRIRAQYHAEAQPFRMGDRPKIRTTQDYLDERDNES